MNINDIPTLTQEEVRTLAEHHTAKAREHEMERKAAMERASWPREQRTSLYRDLVQAETHRQYRDQRAERAMEFLRLLPINTAHAVLGFVPSEGKGPYCNFDVYAST